VVNRESDADQVRSCDCANWRKSRIRRRSGLIARFTPAGACRDHRHIALSRSEVLQLEFGFFGFTSGFSTHIKPHSAARNQGSAYASSSVSRFTAGQGPPKLWTPHSSGVRISRPTGDLTARHLNRIAGDIGVGGLGIASPSPLGVLGAAWPQPPGTSPISGRNGRTFTSSRSSLTSKSAASGSFGVVHRGQTLSSFLAGSARSVGRANSGVGGLEVLVQKIAVATHAQIRGGRAAFRRAVGSFAHVEVNRLGAATLYLSQCAWFYKEPVPLRGPVVAVSVKS
jgi:hypothetical protein